MQVLFRSISAADFRCVPLHSVPASRLSPCAIALSLWIVLMTKAVKNCSLRHGVTMFSQLASCEPSHRHPCHLTLALWKCRGPLRLPTPAPSLANGSTPAPLQSPANASAPDVTASAPAPDAPSAAGQTDSTASTADGARKAATPPESVMAELVALLSHKDNKASGPPAACVHWTTGILLQLPDLHSVTESQLQAWRQAAKPDLLLLLQGAHSEVR